MINWEKPDFKPKLHSPCHSRTNQLYFSRCQSLEKLVLDGRHQKFSLQWQLKRY